MNNYVICTVARSGKSWIAETLYMLGLGYADEVLTHFAQGRAPGQIQLRSAYDDVGMAGLAHAFAQNRISEGHPCVAATLQFTNFENVETEKRARRLAEFVDALSPTLVFFLQRRDRLSQAISHYLMMESGYYHSTSPAGRRSQRTDVPFNRSHIEDYFAFTERSYLGWDELFEAANIVPEILVYEDFMEDPKGCFTSLARRIAGDSFDVPPCDRGPSILGFENGYELYGFADLAPESIMAAAACQSKVSDEKDSAFRKLYLSGSDEQLSAL